MSKYAIVVSASPGYTPGVNAQLNALWHYGIDADFHLVHAGFDKKGGVYETFIDEIKADDFFGPRFFPVEVQSLIDDGYPPPPTSPNKTWRFKFYRYLYAVDRLKDYDAVAIFDADMTIVNNIMDYFEIAAATGRLLITNNDSSGCEYDNYRQDTRFYRSGAAAPLANMPIFFDPKRFVDLFNLVPSLSVKYSSGDMAAVNNTLIETSMIDDVIVLPCALWLQIHFSFVPLVTRIINKKRYIALHKSGDRLFSFHRKFWLEGKCREKIARRCGVDREIAYNNVRVFWEMLRFLNLECRHKIEWAPSWGGFPDDLEGIRGIPTTWKQGYVLPKT